MSILINKINYMQDAGAHFSSCRQYRYALWRIWDRNKPMVMIIGLNPSTADETESDKTITRVKGFSESWGFGGFFMMNLHCYVTEYPDQLVLEEEIHEKVNDCYFEQYARLCQTIVFAWGNFKVAKPRAKIMIEKFPDAFAIILNKNGSPRHPLYIKGDAQLIKFGNSKKFNNDHSERK